MKKERIETGKTAVLTLTSISGNLIIKSWEEGTVYLKGDYSFTEEKPGVLTIEANGRLQMMVPRDTSIAIQKVHGDALLKNVSGNLVINTINGDLVLVNVGATKIDTVHSDLSLKNLDHTLSATTIHGDVSTRNITALTIDTIHGDFSGRNINGSAKLGEVMGDVSFRTVNGDIELTTGHRDVNIRNVGGQTLITQARGDIRIFGGLIPKTHSFTADRDIILRWPTEQPVQIIAAAPKIKNRLSFDLITEGEGMLTGTMGEGGAILNLNAGGSIILKESDLVRAEWGDFDAGTIDIDLDFNIGEIGERVTAQVSQQMEQLSQRMNEMTSDLENRFGQDFGTGFAEKVIRKVEKAAAKAEQAAETARKKAEEQMRRSYDRRYRQKPTPAAEPQSRKATAEEQLKILKMVEQGKISTEEAALLLDALES